MRRMMWTSGAVLVAGLLVAGTAAVVRAEVPDLGIDLNLPKLDEATPTGYWYPAVVNDTGAVIEDATLKVTVDDDTRHRTGVIVGDSPDAVRKSHDDSVPVTDEKCRTPAAGEDEDDSQPSDPGPTYFKVASSVECEQDVETGSTAYSLWIGGLGKPYGGFDSGGAFKATVKAVLSADGRTLDSVKERLTIEPAPRLNRVSTKSIPDLVPDSASASDSEEGTITIANDSGQDLDGGVMTIETDPYSGLVLEPSRDGCSHKDVESSQPTAVVCENIDIPAGDSIKVKVAVYANPDGFDAEKIKHDKLVIKVGTDEDGAGEGDFAKQSQKIWLDPRPER